MHYLYHLIIPLIHGSIIPITDHPFSQNILRHVVNHSCRILQEYKCDFCNITTRAFWIDVT